MPAGLGGLKAWASSHQMVLAGGAGAVALGLAAKSRKGKGAGGATPSQTIVPARNDSTGTDVYNSIEPQIEFLRGQISQLGQQVPASDPQGALQAPGIPPPLAAVPAPVAAVTPTAPTVVPAAPNPPPVPVGGQVNWAVNNPATNPNVSAAPPVYLAPGDALPAATGVGQRYMTPDGFQYTGG